MKAERLITGEIVNPFYSHTDRRAERDAGRRYNVPQFLTLPKAEIVEDPDCWKLCLGEPPAMKPADDECRAKVLAAMGSVKRRAFLQNLTRQNMPEVRRQMGVSQLEWIDSMMETYSGEIDSLAANASQSATEVSHNEF